MEVQTLDPSLLAAAIDRYQALGLYEHRKGTDREHVFLRPMALGAEDFGWCGKPPDEERAAFVVEMRALATAAGIPEEKTGDDADFEARLLTFTASDETCDRYGDRILVDGMLDVGGSPKKFGKGWQLKEYEANPVFLSFHEYRGLPLGTALKTWTDQKGKRKRLRQTVLMDDGTGCPAAPHFTAAYRNRTLRAVSVGFMPTKIHRPADDAERLAWGVGPYGLLFGEQVLWENSAVSVPANPNALLEPKDVDDFETHGREILDFADQVRDVAPEWSYQVRSAYHRLGAFFDLTHRIAAAAPAPELETRDVTVTHETQVVVDAEPEAFIPLDTLLEMVRSLPGYAQASSAEPMKVTVHLDGKTIAEHVVAQATKDGSIAPETHALDSAPADGRVGAAELLGSLARAVQRIEAAAVRFEEAAAANVGEAPGAPAPQGEPQSRRYDQVLDVFSETVRVLKGATKEA